MSYKEEDIRHETKDFWVLSVGTRGYEVYRSGITHSTRVASIGHGPGPNLGLARAISEAEQRQKDLDAETSAEANRRPSRG